MPDEPRKHPVDRTMTWLGSNWWVPVAVAITLEGVARGAYRMDCGKQSPEPAPVEKPAMDLDR